MLLSNLLFEYLDFIKGCMNWSYIYLVCMYQIYVSLVAKYKYLHYLHAVWILLVPW